MRVEMAREPIHEPDVEGEFTYEYTKCNACGEDILSFEQAEAHQRAYAAAVARARGDFTADRIFALRMSLGWSQPRMEEAFGVGPKTWGRWERGTIAPSGPALRLMWLAENDRSEFLRLVDALTHKPQRHAQIAGAIVQQGPGEPAVAFRRAHDVQRIELLSTNGPVDAGNGDEV